ncbi:MAG TPA: SPOR domain-containing protein [Verrucomicrobiae bacterium]|nr:SPOR domain-containing protein [Verrucomicrobiae bacterium]
MTCLQICSLFAACALWIRIGIGTIENCALLRLPIVPVVSHQPLGKIQHGYLKATLPTQYFIKIQARNIEETIALLAPKTPKAAPAVKVEMKTEAPKPQVETAEPERRSEPIAVEPAENPYTIQLVTYMSEARAMQEVEALKGKGCGAFIIPSGSYYQVCINHFAEKPQAHEEMLKLQNQGVLDVYQGAYVRQIHR